MSQASSQLLEETMRMTIHRAIELEMQGSRLTTEEVQAGYHFCPDWDYMVIGPEDTEFEYCNCELRTANVNP